MNIVVAILTTGTRMPHFEKCLKSVIAQNTPQNSQISLLVVENNSVKTSSVSSLIERLQASTERQIHYKLETKRGIPAARNFALNYAIDHDYTHLAFIDDDAYALEDWLVKLTENIGDNDIVSGPQKATFPDFTPARYKLAKVYQHRNIQDNEKIDWAATNNILISLQTIKKMQLNFNQKLKNGGEDKEFTLKVAYNGGKLAWRREAVVKEHIVDNRMNLKWALRRTFRMGATGFMIESCNKSTAKVYATCLFKGCAYIAKGLLSYIPYALSNKHSTLDCLCDLSHGVGFIYGLFTKGKVSSYA